MNDNINILESEIMENENDTDDGFYTDEFFDEMIRGVIVPDGEIAKRLEADAETVAHVHEQIESLERAQRSRYRSLAEAFAYPVEYAAKIKRLTEAIVADNKKIDELKNART
jgi:hypothetical protein